MIIVIAVLIKLQSTGPVLHSVTREGRKGKTFGAFRFRTMHPVLEWANHFGEPLGHLWDTRVTRIGVFLRRGSLDEIPVLINVLRGDMSIIGPRPCLPTQDGSRSADEELLEDTMRPRRLVKPGVIGLAQLIKPVNELDALRLDDYYVKNRSFWLDLKIIISAFDLSPRRVTRLTGVLDRTSGQK